MALTSRTHGVTGRIRTATSNLHEDNQSLISDIGKAFSLMKKIAVDFERAKQFERLTDFGKLFKNEVAQLKANSSSVPQNHPLMREFREAVWLDKVKYDPLLAAEIDDLRKIQNQSAMTDVMDVTEFEE